MNHLRVHVRSITICGRAGLPQLSCYFVCLYKISQKVYNQSTSFWVGASFPADSGKKSLDLEKKRPRGLDAVLDPLPDEANI